MLAGRAPHSARQARVFLSLFRRGSPGSHFSNEPNGALPLHYIFRSDDVSKSLSILGRVTGSVLRPRPLSAFATVVNGLTYAGRLAVKARRVGLRRRVRRSVPVSVIRRVVHDIPFATWPATTARRIG